MFQLVLIRKLGFLLQQASEELMTSSPPWTEVYFDKFTQSFLI